MLFNENGNPISSANGIWFSFNVYLSDLAQFYEHLRNIENVPKNWKKTNLLNNMYKSL